MGFMNLSRVASLGMIVASAVLSNGCSPGPTAFHAPESFSDAAEQIGSIKVDPKDASLANPSELRGAKGASMPVNVFAAQDMTAEPPLNLTALPASTGPELRDGLRSAVEKGVADGVQASLRQTVMAAKSAFDGPQLRNTQVAGAAIRISNPGQVFAQLGAYGARESALRAAERLKQRGGQLAEVSYHFSNVTTQDHGVMTRLLVGPLSLSKAQSLCEEAGFAVSACVRSKA